MDNEAFHDPLPDCYDFMMDIYTLEKTVDALYAAAIETPTSAVDLPGETSKVRQFNSLLYQQIELTKAKLALRRIQANSSIFDSEYTLSAVDRAATEEKVQQTVLDFCALLKEKVQKV